MDSWFRRAACWSSCRNYQENNPRGRLRGGDGDAPVRRDRRARAAEPHRSIWSGPHRRAALAAAGPV